MTSAAPYTLHYFNMPGRGMQIRLLFDVSKTPFEDHRIGRGKKGWDEAKADMPWRCVPVLDHGEIRIFDSAAIVGYVAEQVGLWPEEPELRALSYALLNRIDSMWGFLSGFVKIKNPLRLMVLANKLRSTELPSFCELFQSHIRGPYVLGETMTAIDLSIYALMQTVLKQGKPMGTPSLVARYPQLLALVERVAEHPEVASHKS
jgi:prostaglandin-H2 D-isomerase / glutathione transferase